MKSILICYFSGTGNTEKISCLLRDELERNSCTVTLVSVESLLESPESEHIKNLQNFDLIGIGYPIYGFGTPRIIHRLVEQFSDGAGKSIFLFKTGADFISINHNASTELIEELEDRNFTVFYDRIIVMNSNWIISYNDRISKQLYLCAENKVKHMCGEILEQKVRRYRTGTFLKGLSLGISHLEKNYGSAYFGKSLRVNNSCNNCGVCVKRCPGKNIQFENDKPVFGDNCLWCMRCIYSCPQKAIVSKGMNFCIIKEGYNLDRILNDDNIDSNFITGETGGYFKHLYRYLSDESL